jgi:AcrR family transcriptional regulator
MYFKLKQQEMSGKDNPMTLRQQEIVNAARKIITTKGTKSLTIRQIAKELRITNGALYRHFESKDGIVKLLVQDIEDSLLKNIKKAAEASDDHLQKLKNIFFSHLSYTEQRKGSTFIIINKTLSTKNKKLQKQMYVVVRQYLKTIETILSEGIASGRFRRGIKVSFASIAFFGMIQGVVTIWSLSGFDPCFMNNLSELFDIYKSAILI